MGEDQNKDGQLRSGALPNAKDISATWDTVEEELVHAKAALEAKTGELATSRAMLQATLEAAADGILVTDVGGKVINRNRKYAEMWQLPPAILETKDHWQLQEFCSRHLHDPQHYLSQTREIYAAAPLESHDLLKLIDGRLFERASTIQYVGDRNVGRVWSFRDITARTKAEEDSLRLSAVVESSDDAIISKTLQGIITSWNKAAERIFGYAAQEVIGLPISILFPPDRLEEERDILARLRRGERIDHYETERIRKDGTRLNVSLTVSVIKDTSGRIIGASKIARNITERKQAEQALQEAQMKLSLHAEELEKQVVQRTLHLNESIQSLESVCYTIAHDLRAPLRAVQGFTQVILEEYAPAFDDEGKILAARVMTAATRMDALIRDLLEYAKLSHVDLPCGPMELNPVVQKVIENLNQEIISGNAQISVQTLPQIWGNPIIVEQIFTNILSNALKFVEEEVAPIIEIRAESTEHGPRILIKDNGIGIAAEHHERIFEIFQRLHENEKQFPGTGIGLAIVKKGIERIGGQVGLDARVTNGSCFCLDFQPARDL